MLHGSRSKHLRHDVLTGVSGQGGRTGALQERGKMIAHGRADGSSCSLSRPPPTEANSGKPAQQPLICRSFHAQLSRRWRARFYCSMLRQDWLLLAVPALHILHCKELGLCTAHPHSDQSKANVPSP